MARDNDHDDAHSKMRHFDDPVKVPGKIARCVTPKIQLTRPHAAQNAASRPAPRSSMRSRKAPIRKLLLTPPVAFCRRPGHVVICMTRDTPAV